MLYQVISARPGEIAPKLRDRGLGVTAWRTEGRSGEREVIFVVVRRSLGRRVTDMIEELNPQDFVVRLEPTWFKGGFLQKYVA
ncbi:MAG: hypothetical protein JWN15_2051 [Firmicutes bacterium]|nr:hypothetical protein [Bacillota bacterium]